MNKSHKNRIDDLESIINSLKQQKRALESSYQYLEDYRKKQIERLETRCYNLDTRLREKNLYYAVVTGKTGGVFISCIEAMDAIENCNGILRTCKTLAEAKEFINEFTNETISLGE